MSLASSEEGQSGQSGQRMGLCSQRATDVVPGCQWWFGGGATEPSMGRIGATSFPERRSRWVPTYLGTLMSVLRACNQWMGEAGAMASCGKWPGGRPPREEHCPSDDASPPPPEALINTLVGGTSGIRVSSSLLLLHEPLFLLNNLKVVSPQSQTSLLNSHIYCDISTRRASIRHPSVANRSLQLLSTLIDGRFRSPKRPPASQGPCGSRGMDCTME